MPSRNLNERILNTQPLFPLQLLCSTSHRKGTVSIWRMNELKQRGEAPRSLETLYNKNTQRKGTAQRLSPFIKMVLGKRVKLKARKLRFIELCPVPRILSINRLFSCNLKTVLRDFEGMDKATCLNKATS